MESSREARPFESLDWYRQASRDGFRERPGTAIGRWLRSVGSLALHLSLFSGGLVLLYVVNLVRSPERLWADRAAWAWLILLGIHALVLGIIWAVDLLRDDEVDEPIRVPEVAWRATAPWPRPPASPPSTDVAPPPGERLANDPQAAPENRQPPTAPADPWAAWGADVQPPPSGEQSSWKEAAGWLTRRRGPASEPDAVPEPAPAPEANKDARPEA